MAHKLIFRDNHILVVEKPADLLTQPAEGQEASLLTELSVVLAKEKGLAPERVFLHPAHRLDRGASGLVLFAKTSKALSRLNEAFRERRVKKKYFALIEGETPKKGTLKDFIVHGDYRAHIVEKGGRDAKEAHLDFKTIGSWRGGSVVEIELHTGRYHQIRAQFAFRGAPIAGDVKYGSKTPYRKGAIALCHAFLALDHPVGGAPLVFELPIPDEWKIFDIDRDTL